MWINGAPTVGSVGRAPVPAGAIWNNAGPQVNTQSAYQAIAQRPASAAGWGEFLRARPPQQQVVQPTPQSFNATPATRAQPGQWNAFNHGAGGVDGNGMISSRTHNLLTGELFKGQYEEALYNKQNGIGTPMSDRQIENLRQNWLLHEGQGRTDRSIMQFARPQFEYDPKFYNELARLDHTGRSQDLASMLPPELLPYHTDERWGGIHGIGPAGTSFGGGDGGGDAWGTASFAPEQARAVIPDVDRTRNRVYNGGDLRSANDFGSYQTALLRSGAGDISSVASIHPRQGGGYSTASDDATGFNQRFQEIAKPPGSAAQPPASNQSMRGPIQQDEQGYFYDPNYFDPSAPPRKVRLGGGGAIVGGGNLLPWMVASTPKVETAAQHADAARGRYLGEMVEAQRDFNKYLQDVYFAQPVPHRASLMSRNQGVFGGYE